MSGSKQYQETCICGASITITENFSFIPSSEFKEIYHNWKQEHKDCLPLFHQIQKARAKRLLLTGN